MDDKDIEFAVRYYQKQKKQGGCSYEQFLNAIKDHIARRPAPYNSFDPFALAAAASKVWRVLEMSMKEIVDYSGKDMAKFARRFCIPYRTLQAWCDGTNECPIYIKLMICEVMKMYSRAVVLDPNVVIQF